jgi:hypothetical protein
MISAAIVICLRNLLCFTYTGIWNDEDVAGAAGGFRLKIESYYKRCMVAVFTPSRHAGLLPHEIVFNKSPLMQNNNRYDMTCFRACT